MYSAPNRYSLDSVRASPRRRGIALLLALIVHALIIMLLLRQAPPMSRMVESAPTTFQLLPDRGAEPASAKASPKESESKGKAPDKALDKAAPPPIPPVITLPTPPPPPPVPDMIILNRDEFAATDISKMQRGEASGSADAGAGKDSVAVYGPGQGPGGKQLFEAEWYRRPTDAELAFYMPNGAPVQGWGLVACQTVEKYHVDNCQMLGESPPGSGLAHAVRRAAWQFLVRPPRIDGRPMIGAWVRIRIEYTQRGAAPSR